MSENPLITLFSAPKPFTNPHIATIQRNAIRSWVELGGNVEVVLLGDEAGMAEAAAELGVRQIAEVKRNALGTPLISSLFDLARGENHSPLLAYVNADILLLPDFLEAANELLRQAGEFLMVGQRWDMEITGLLDFSAGWSGRLREECRQHGALHKPMGSDYFVYPRACFERIPDFAIGRAGWDNWMIYEARRRGWKTVDATADVMIIHQAHDYSHLPNGQPHYRLPETGENIRLAGGKRHIFLLSEANWALSGGKLKRKRMTWQQFWREFELFPAIHMRSTGLAELFHTVFHPRKAYDEFRKSKREKSSAEELVN